jgi:hypothetical protein
VTILFLTFCFVGRNGNITGYTMWNMWGSTYHKICRSMVPRMWRGSMLRMRELLMFWMF